MLSTVLTILLAAVPLVDAVKTGDRTAALAMIEQRINVNTPEADGTTALHWAIHRNDMDLVDRLIRAGANVKAKNDFGATPMSEAALLGNAALLDKLLKAGADVESPNTDGQTALMVVARTGNVEAAKVLLSHGANVNAREQWREQTALIWAAAQNLPACGRIDTAALFLARGVHRVHADSGGSRCRPEHDRSGRSHSPPPGSS